jgi:hemoglobin
VRAQLQQVLDRYVSPAGGAGAADLLGEVPADAAVREAVQRRQLLLDAHAGQPWRPRPWWRWPRGCWRPTRPEPPGSDGTPTPTTHTPERPRAWAASRRARLVDRFYDLMDLEPAYTGIRALHPSTLDGSRDKLFWFLCGWLGGPNHYIERFGHPRLRARHLPYAIGLAERDQWLACMGRPCRSRRSTRRWPSGWPNRSSAPPTGCATGPAEGAGARGPPEPAPVRSNVAACPGTSFSARRLPAIVSTLSTPSVAPSGRRRQEPGDLR